MQISRRKCALLLAGVSVAAVLPSMAPAAGALSADTLQDWLTANAIPLRSADPTDEDFSDLLPLVDRIGDARVVQLGEPSHGAGTAFAAKARLVKFLHQKMGFDVLVWESGFYDLTRVEAGLARGDDAIASAKRGVLQIWSASEECRPLFEYAKNSHAGPRPLMMAGFDMQLTSDAFADLAAELRAFVGGLHEPALRRQAAAAANEALAAFKQLNRYAEATAEHAAALSRAGTTAMGEAMAKWERETGAKLRPQQADLDRVRRAVTRLSTLFERHQEAFAKTGGEQRLGFISHVVANLAGYGANMYEQFGASVPARPDAELIRENRRDALNAENLRWLIEQGYPGKKLIVWAHNVHVMNAYYGADWKSINLDASPGTMKPMGAFLAERFDKAVYTIGLTAYQGEDAWVGNPSSPVPPAPTGSIEERLHRLGKPYAFLDLRAARALADSPLHKPQLMRLPKYDAVEIADITRPYDAVLYIDQVKGATLIH